MIAERLRTLRRERGLSKRELVSLLPVNYSTYANYESGLREPGCETLGVLARYFDTTVDYILGLSESVRRPENVAGLTDSEHDLIAAFRKLGRHGREMVELILSKELERAPAITKNSRDVIELRVYNQRASAGLGNYLSDDSDNDFELMRFPSGAASQQADFCVRLRGDSMEPKFTDGDIVYVKATPQVETGQIGIFIFEGEAYCKRLHIDHKKGAIVLESLNRSFAPKTIKNPDALRTVGRVLSPVG
jgi:repressor LexA